MLFGMSFENIEAQVDAIIKIVVLAVGGIASIKVAWTQRQRKKNGGSLHQKVDKVVVETAGLKKELNGIKKEVHKLDNRLDQLELDKMVACEVEKRLKKGK